MSIVPKVDSHEFESFASVRIWAAREHVIFKKTLTIGRCTSDCILRAYFECCLAREILNHSCSLIATFHVKLESVGNFLSSGTERKQGPKCNSLLGVKIDNSVNVEGFELTSSIA